MNHSMAKTFLTMAAVSVLGGATVLAQQGPPGEGGGPEGTAQMHAPPRPPKPVGVAGKVLNYNHGPRGEVEGVILQAEGKIVQVNTPPGMGSLLMTIAPVGKDVKLLGRTPPPPRDGREPKEKADHDVFEFAGVDDGSTPPPTTEPADLKVEGTVASLNYGRRGEVNGAVLDSGDFVAIGPREAAEMKLAVGQKIAASGDATPMADGHQAIAAKEVNGKEIKRPGPPPPPPAG